MITTLSLLTSRRIGYAALAAATALSLSACGSSGSSGGGTSATTNTGAAAANSGQGNGVRPTGGRQLPGAAGLIAAVQGATLQVQSTTAQTAVVVSSSTKISAQVAAAAKDLKVGECVSARPARSTASATSAPSAANQAQPTTVAAATIEITPAQNGQCMPGGFGGGFRGGAGGGPGGPPSGAPTPDGTRTFGGGQRPGGFGGFGAFGTVASLGTGTLTVTEAARPDDNGATSAPRTVTVTWTSATKFTTLKSATTAAIKVGECARAFGTADSTGTVTARTLSLSPAVNGSCGGGFGGGRGN